LDEIVVSSDTGVFCGANLNIWFAIRTTTVLSRMIYSTSFCLQRCYNWSL